jgi:prevent-host-death family protein
LLQVNIHEAKTHLSKLIEKAAAGEPFIIAKAGKPMVTVVPFNPAQNHRQRVGFLKGQIKIPADFDRLGGQEIQDMFETNISEAKQ